MKLFFTTSIADIRFWLALFFVVRLWGITHPPLDGSHHWRQTLTASMARNFYEMDSCIFYPQIDYAFGDHHGWIASEFPLFSWLISAVSHLFGYEHWYGRLLNLIVTTLGTWFFFRLLKLFYTGSHAFFATLFLTVSLWFAFGRKVMPDTFSMSLMITGLYYSVLFLKEKQWWQLVLFFLLATAGGLCKLPVAFALVVPCLLVLDTSTGWKQRLSVAAACTASALAVCWWYFIWLPHLLAQGAHRLFFTKTVVQGFNELAGLKHELFRRFFFDNTQSYILTVFAIAGCVLLVLKDRKWRFLLAASAPFILFFMLKSGETFAMHNYYQIPFVPLTCMAAGFLLTAFPGRWAVVVTVLVISESMINQVGDLGYPSRRAYKLELAEIMNGISVPDELIAVVGDLNPSDMYFAHRRGWMLDQRDLTEEKFSQLKLKGCRLLLVNKRTSDARPQLEEIFEDENFIVYEVD